MDTAREKATNPKPRLNSAFKQLMSIHWWMAWLYGVLFLGGWYMSELPDEVSYRGMLYDFHKSVGLLTLAMLTWRILVLLRVWWKKYTKRLPKFTAKWYQKFVLHSILYLFMWGVPVTGIFLSNSYKANHLKFFGLLVPDLFPENRAVVGLGRDLHFWLSYVFLSFVILHMVAQWKVIRAYWRQSKDFFRRNFAKS